MAGPVAEGGVPGAEAPSAAEAVRDAQAVRDAEAVRNAGGLQDVGGPRDAEVAAAGATRGVAGIGDREASGLALVLASVRPTC